MSIGAIIGIGISVLAGVLLAFSLGWQWAERKRAQKVTQVITERVAETVTRAAELRAEAAEKLAEINPTEAELTAQQKRTAELIRRAAEARKTKP